MNCRNCGFALDPLDKECLRCTKTRGPATIPCPRCQRMNGPTSYACSFCDTRLPTDLATLEKRPIPEYYEKARNAWNQGHIRTSLSHLLEVTDLYPDDVQTRQEIIRLAGCVNAQQIAEIQQDITRIQMQASADHCLNLAARSEASGDRTTTLEILETATRFHATHPLLFEKLADLYDANGDSDKALFYRGQAVRAMRRLQRDDTLNNPLPNAQYYAHGATVIGDKAFWFRHQLQPPPASLPCYATYFWPSYDWNALMARLPSDDPLLNEIRWQQHEEKVIPHNLNRLVELDAEWQAKEAERRVLHNGLERVSAQLSDIAGSAAATAQSTDAIARKLGGVGGGWGGGGVYIGEQLPIEPPSITIKRRAIELADQAEYLNAKILYRLDEIAGLVPARAITQTARSAKGGCVGVLLLTVSLVLGGLVIFRGLVAL